MTTAAPGRLTTSADRKTSPSVRVRKDKSDAYPNTFGIPAGPRGSCARVLTRFCLACYASSIERQWPTVARKLARNFAILLACADEPSEHIALVRALDTMLAAWYVETLKRGVPLTFRIHWDGDFYSETYAAAWADICRAYPDVTFWLYTRAIFAIPYLAGINNLRVYASVDAYNVDAWRDTLARYPSVKVAACAETFEESQDLIRKLERRAAPKCPEGVRLPLVVGASGRRSDIPSIGETGRGACDACGLCIQARSDIRFATNKRSN